MIRVTAHTSAAIDNSALVVSNKPYAAMMRFGGDKSEFPHLWGDIPGRPWLPMDAEGIIQPEAEDAILDLALHVPPWTIESRSISGLPHNYPGIYLSPKQLKACRC